MPPHAQFEVIVEKHQAAVFRTLLRLTGSREHVEDLAQEVFLRLFRALPTFRGEALLSTYLYRITLNVAQDEWKRRRRIDRPLVSLSAPAATAADSTQLWEDCLADASPAADRQLTTHELQLAVDEEILALSNVERTALVLYQSGRAHLHRDCRDPQPSSRNRAHTPPPRPQEAAPSPSGPHPKKGPGPMSEPLIPQPPTAQRNDFDRLTNAIGLALVTPPAVHIPANFATRVANLAPARQTSQPAVALPPPRNAQTAIVLCTIAVLIALLTLIPGILTRNPSHALTFTWLLCVEAVLLAAALGPWRSFWTSSQD